MKLIYLILVSILICCYSACSDDDQDTFMTEVTAGLVAYYPMDGHLRDSVGSNDGELFGPVPAVDRNGSSGGALAFDGTDDYGAIPNATAINFANDDDFSLSLWLQFGAQTALSRSWNVIIEKLDEEGEISDAYPYALRVYNGTSELPGTLFGRRLARNEDRSCNVRSEVHDDVVAYADNSFHHVVYQRSGDKLQLFVNGNAVATGVDSSAFACSTRNVAPLHLGARLAGTDNLRHFKGTMDDLHIYNRALEPEEVRLLSEQ